MHIIVNGINFGALKIFGALCGRPPCTPSKPALNTITTVQNYDIDSMTNSMASRLVSADHDLSQRMVFHTSDIMDVTDELKDYDVIFLAALVGMNIDDKNKVIQHLAKNMAPDFHLDNDVINSVVISRKFMESVNIDNNYHDLDIGSLMASSCKYCDIQRFNYPLGHMKMIDEPM
ncbi:nicotianamine synthase, S-adenosyl-L-methionine-dependent methyltransferase [Tanacetum coccineum]